MTIYFNATQGSQGVDLDFESHKAENTEKLKAALSGSSEPIEVKNAANEYLFERISKSFAFAVRDMKDPSSDLYSAVYLPLRTGEDTAEAKAAFLLKVLEGIVINALSGWYGEGDTYYAHPYGSRKFHFKFCVPEEQLTKALGEHEADAMLHGMFTNLVFMLSPQTLLDCAVPNYYRELAAPDRPEGIADDPDVKAWTGFEFSLD